MVPEKKESNRESTAAQRSEFGGNAVGGAEISSPRRNYRCPPAGAGEILPLLRALLELAAELPLELALGEFTLVELAELTLVELTLGAGGAETPPCAPTEAPSPCAITTGTLANDPADDPLAAVVPTGW